MAINLAAAGMIIWASSTEDHSNLEACKTAQPIESPVRTDSVKPK